MTDVVAETKIPETGFDQVFDALAWEIELAGARCIFLDSLIGDLMKELPDSAKDKIQDGLQAVDLLSQHLTGLSAFARQIAIDTPVGQAAPVEEALKAITLGALADRLITSFGGEGGGVDDRAGAGDLDLF